MRRTHHRTGTSAPGALVRLAIAAMAVVGLVAAGPAPAGGSSQTGWAVKKPVFAAACPHACPWGELGEFVQESMAPMGYDVILCRNCNRDRGPRLVAAAAKPPPLDQLDAFTGTTVRVDAPVDFGVTASDLLAAAYEGKGGYAQGGALKNLRLIAKIEDPTYLLVAVKASSGITDLAQIAEKKMPVKILAGGGAAEVLAYYGITPEALKSWGGSMGRAMGAGKSADFDVIIDDLGSPANNPESNAWTVLSQAYDLRFLDLPEPLLAKLAQEPGAVRVTARWGLVRGVDHAIHTIGRSGEAVFARADTPDQAAYDVAKAIDQHRGQLKWLIRPYSYDPHTVTENMGVPLHPGAARYYRQMGYLK